MQRCPNCGVRNLDSDIVCFNCEEVLNGKNGKNPAGSSTVVSAPIPIPENLKDIPDVLRPERPVRKTRFLGLVLGTLLYKLFLLVLSLGLFSIISLLEIWLAYNNTWAAGASFVILGLTVLISFIYPDIARARLNGRKGGFVAMLSNLIILAVFLPPVLILVEKKVHGAAGYVLDYYWVVLALLAGGFLVGFISGYYAWRKSST